MTLGWLVVPVLFTGIDQTLDPRRFATFALPRRRLLLGLLAAALVGLPGVVAVRARADHHRHLVAVTPGRGRRARGRRGRRADLRDPQPGRHLRAVRPGPEPARPRAGHHRRRAAPRGRGPQRLVGQRPGRPAGPHAHRGRAAGVDPARSGLGGPRRRRGRRARHRPAAAAARRARARGAAGPLGPAAAPRPGEPPLGQRPWRRAAGRGRMVRPAARHAHRGRRGPLGDVLAPRPALPAVGGHDAAAAARAAGPGGRRQRRLAARDGAADGLPARLGDAQRPGLRRHGVLAARQHRCRRTGRPGRPAGPDGGARARAGARVRRAQQRPHRPLADAAGRPGCRPGAAAGRVRHRQCRQRPHALPGPGLGRQPVRHPARGDRGVAARAAGVRGRRRHPQRPRAGAVAGRPGRVRLAGVGLPAGGAGARRGLRPSSACGRARGSTSGGRRTCCRTWPGSVSRGRGRRPARPRR